MALKLSRMLEARVKAPNALYFIQAFFVKVYRVVVRIAQTIGVRVGGRLRPILGLDMRQYVFVGASSLSVQMMDLKYALERV